MELLQEGIPMDWALGVNFPKSEFTMFSCNNALEYFFEQEGLFKAKTISIF